MPDRPVEVEKTGIEHIPDEQRHGSPGRVFTLWFAANLTIADYVVGVLSVQVFGLTLLQAIPVLAVGNVLGGLFLGLSAGMGPKLGYPQMVSSRSSFGRRGNYVFGGLNWISSAGWFTVNTILGVEAIQVVFPSLNFYLGAVVLVASQVLVAVYGHDFIHLFEKVMSILLGLLFLGILLAAYGYGNAQHVSIPSFASPALGAVGIVLAASFSYLMSWSPYASDYSRYLSTSTSGRRVALYALGGGAIASFSVEVIGAYVGTFTRNQGFFEGLYVLAGWFGPFAILAVVLGALAANALNIYTNSLSALVLDVRTKRWVTVVAGGVVGLALAAWGQVNFESSYENFLLVLGYWIMPWLGIVLVDYYVSHRTTVDSSTTQSSWDFKALGIYALAVLVSIPFMVPAIQVPSPFGSLAYIFGGADFSYFISFGVAALSAYLVRGR